MVIEGPYENVSASYLNVHNATRPLLCSLDVLFELHISVFEVAVVCIVLWLYP